MRAHIKLGRIFGIELGLHYSWLLVALLITASLASQFHYNHPRWGVGVIWGSALITSLLFFACLFAHELSHAVVARSRKLPVRSITLFALGGVTQVEAESPNASTEFWIGIAGPITSWVLGFILLATAFSIGWAPHSTPPSPSLAILVWLGYINIALGVFNMLPGFPLDGGRVLRALVWRITGDLRRATRLATRVGQAAALTLILYGILQFFSGAGLGGLWLTFVGSFLLQAAGATQLQSEATVLLKDLRAEELMSRDCVSLAGEITVQQFVHDYLLRTARRCFVVTEQTQMVGIITPGDIRSVDRARWPVTPIRLVMRPMENVCVISPETSVLKVIELMAREDVNQLPVISNRQVVGFVSRDTILQVLHTRAALKTAA